MAVELFLGPVVDATVFKVIDYASNQVNLALEWKDDLKKFRLIMKMVGGVLQDANERHVTGQRHLTAWLEELRDIVDEAEDVFDEMAYEDLRQKVAAQKLKWKKVSYFFTQSNPIAFRLRIANRVRNLNSYLADVNEWAHRLGLQYRLAHTTTIFELGHSVRQTHSFQDASTVIGRVEARNEIIRMLTDSSNDQEKLSVISIVGMGGLGKTTLAKEVCASDEIRSYFGKIMWVCVSETFEVQRILGEMCESLTKSSCTMKNSDTIIKKIKEELEGKEGKKEGKSYLLILDDVWNEVSEKWEDLRNCLLAISTDVRNRVLVTTRSRNVARIVGTRIPEHLHCLKELKDDQCWSIIRERAFGEQCSIPPELEEVGLNIAKKCKGIPLVAKVIGGILCNKQDVSVWESFQKKIGEWESLGDEYDRVEGILKLSFDRLPIPALKQCFAFCSIFPKDSVIEKEMLIQLWMAEGYLQPSKGSSLEDVGDKYFNYLLACSLLLEEERDSLGEVKTCKMHDIIHDLAKSITERETVVFDAEFKSSISDVGSQNKVPAQVRHLNLIDDVPANLRSVADQLRTLLLKRGCPNSLLADLRRLRAISFRDTNTKQLPPCFSKLKSLSFLDISKTRIQKLPKALSKLYNLQTFRYMDSRLRRRPKGIENLLNLRHLYFNQGRLMPANLGRLTNLQTLQLFCVGKKKGFKIGELGSLCQLRGKLKIVNLERVRGKSEAKRAKLSEKAIKKLRLDFNNRREESSSHHEDVLEGLRPPSNLRELNIDGYLGTNLPSWVLELTFLVELKIKWCTMLKCIPQLEGVSSLKRVVIVGCKELSRIDDGAFSSNTSLEELEIRECPKLENVSVDRLSSLHTLSIKWCANLGGTGENLSLPKCLKYLRLGNCDSLRCISSLNGLSSLKSIDIYECKQLERLPSNLSSCTALESFSIGWCNNLRCIPSVDGLISLKSVYIQDCDQLECLPTGLSSCTALESIEIRSCNKLFLSPKELEVLPSLAHLVFDNCPNLKSNPPSPDVGESLTSLDRLRKLEIYSYSVGAEAFLSSIHCLPSIQVMILSTRGELTSSWIKPKTDDALTPLPQHIQCYTSLKELRIYGFQVELLPPSPPHGLGEPSSLTKLEIKNSNLISIPEGLKELPSLVELAIFSSPRVRSFPAGGSNFSCLTSLRRLTLGGFSEDLEEFPELSSFPPTPNLEYLHLFGWKKLTQLPHQIIQHLGERASSLKGLIIEEFNGIETLPEWLGNLFSLQELVINECRYLKHLPTAEAIRRLSNLLRLEIVGCRALKKRCRKGKGPEWSKISHIPNIKIDDENIKSED